MTDRCVSALVPQAAIDAAVLAASKPAHDDGHTDCFYAGILLAAWPHLNAHRPSEVALEKSLDHPTWVVHLSKREHAFDDRTTTWVGVAEDRAAADRAALAWAPGYFVGYADGPFVPARQRDRLRAKVTHLKEEQVSLVGALGDAQAEVERLRDESRDLLAAQGRLASWLDDSKTEARRFAAALESIAEMGCTCTGFYRCGTCVQTITNVAESALQTDDEHRAPEGIDGARRFDLAGQPLCFSCGKTQSEHEGGIECARPSRETEQAK